MSFSVTVQPSGRTFQVDRDEPILLAAIRQGIGLPYGCKDGACGSCKCRLLEGRVIHGTHQAKALSDAEEEAGLMLTCRAAAQTDVVLEARTVPGLGEFPVRKMPTRVARLERPAADVVVLTMQLPANDDFQYKAGQYVEFILRDGDRRSYSIANAPHRQRQLLDNAQPAIELHLRHMPGGKFTDHVFSALKERDILRIEGPFGSFFLREDRSRPLILLASGTGFAPIKALIEQLEHAVMTQPAHLYWGCRRRADLYQHEWAEDAARRLPQLSYTPVLSEDRSGHRLAGPHRLRSSRRDARLPGAGRLRCLRLRCAGHGGRRTEGFRAVLWPAGGSLLRRCVHVRGRQASGRDRRSADAVKDLVRFHDR